MTTCGAVKRNKSDAGARKAVGVLPTLKGRMARMECLDGYGYI